MPPQGTSTAIEGARKRPTRTLESDEEGSDPAVLTSEAEPSQEVEEPEDVPPQEAESEDLVDPSPEEVKPANVNGPIRALIHRNLANAWSINKKLQMCYIFDSVSPARHFKRGMPFSAKADFPILEGDELGNVTDTDVDPPGLMPYAHNPHRYAIATTALYRTLTPFGRTQYSFKSAIAADMFMSWKVGEVRTVYLGQWRKRRGLSSTAISFSPYQIPAPYDRLVGQLVAEHLHSDLHDSHESRRRGVYALQTLDAFGDELKAFKRLKLPVVSFRSKVLTPILQRQRLGIYDAYMPFVTTCIAGTGRKPSIEDISQLYLGKDPADLIYIRQYRRHLLYLPEPRWHLAVVMRVSGNTPKEQKSHYNRVRENHDRIMATPLAEAHAERDLHGIPLLTCTEIEVIFDERLEDFFTEELGFVVGSTCSHSPPSSHHQIP